LGTISSYSDHAGLLEAINGSYPVSVDRIALHRDLIGHVYFCSGCGKGGYALKLYRPHHAENALNSIGIISYLRGKGFPAVPVIPTAAGEMSINIATPGGRCVAILFERVWGVEPAAETEIADIGLQAARLHGLMKSYPGRLARHGKGFYVDRYISLMREKRYDRARVRELDELGERLWRRMEKLPGGFCHGDLHTGNMLRTESGEYVLFDWDAASWTSPVVDVATLCDASDFNVPDVAAYDPTMRRLERFYQGYSKAGTLTQAEMDAVFTFIPVRHYEIIATITSCRGLDGISEGFLDEQYEWLLRWEEMCDRRRGAG